MFNFYSRGEKVKVTIDDRLPMYPTDRRYRPRLYNSKMGQYGSWWGALMEKAYCKMNIACTFISGGSSMQGFRELTGMPVEEFRLNKQSNRQFFNIMHEANKKDWIMTVSTRHPVHGLAAGHAYTLLHSYTHNGEDLVQLRNPWGKSRYTGPYSKTDKIWKKYPGLAKKLNGQFHENNNDGVFWIPVSVIRKAFYRYFVCMYQDWKIDKYRLKPIRAKQIYFNIRSPITQDAVVSFDW